MSEQEVGKDLVVRLGQLVEVHGISGAMMADSSIGAADRPTLVVVGAATRDIAADDPRGWKLGGGVTYSALAAAAARRHASGP